VNLNEIFQGLKEAGSTMRGATPNKLKAVIESGYFDDGKFPAKWLAKEHTPIDGVAKHVQGTLNNILSAKAGSSADPLDDLRRIIQKKLVLK